MSYHHEMYVLKRNGNTEPVSFDKILNRIKRLGSKDNLNIQYTSLVIKVIEHIFNGIKTSEIDEVLAQQCASQSTEHPDYQLLAGRIVISNHQKNTPSTLMDVVNCLYKNQKQPILSKTYYDFVIENNEVLENMIDYNRDYLIDYFGFKTLEKAYLLRDDTKIYERPQHLWMRVAVGLYCNVSCYSKKEKLNYIRDNYNALSLKYFIHATPTLYNIGTPREQLSSCYLISMEDDSMEGIYNTLKDCSIISKYAGGIGLHIHNIRSKGSNIRGTNGKSSGIVPMLRVYNMTARYANQAGRRPGSFAIYLEPWHKDIMSFLEMKKNHGDEEARARDLFYGLWIPDLFMKRVKEKKKWTLLCPDECPGLSDVYGTEFEQLYETYESRGYGVSVEAREIWFKILESQIETGTPYMLYKDHCNNKSNQKNLGTIKSSNLCTEIIEYSSPKETAVCNLNSLVLSSYVNENEKTFDFKKLGEMVELVVRNLNNVIDINFYPTEKTYHSNMLHRPIGIGVQGLADCFLKLDLAYHSKEAQELNRLIFETIYYHSIRASCILSKERVSFMKQLKEDYNNGQWKFKNHDCGSCREYIICNENYDTTKLYAMNPIRNEILSLEDTHLGAYSSFEGSPISNGLFQFNLWSKDDDCSRYDWKILRSDVLQYGIRNSLLVAPMPTASTSQIMGNNECFEPFTNNIYVRRTIAGEFMIINKYLIREFYNLGIWTKELKDNIIKNNGSIQHLDLQSLCSIGSELEEHIKQKYKTVWEISMKDLINMSRDRGQYICQSQSLNLFMESPTFSKLTAMHFYSWKEGLKTGMYYLRTRASAKAQQFTIEQGTCDTCSA